MKYIIGLGNPGGEYEGTKHNIGFAVVNAIAKEFDIALTKKRYGSLLGKGVIGGKEVTLVMPQTFMNLSGKAVEELVREEGVEATDVLVICDDINLELGKIRLRKKGSSGGQKGLESIINELGHGDFDRLRVGIATDVHKGDITEYVLSPFKRKDHKHVVHVIELAKDAVVSWAEKGMTIAMNKFNKRRVGTS